MSIRETKKTWENQKISKRHKDFLKQFGTSQNTGLVFLFNVPENFETGQYIVKPIRKWHLLKEGMYMRMPRPLHAIEDMQQLLISFFLIQWAIPLYRNVIQFRIIINGWKFKSHCLMSDLGKRTIFIIYKY